MLRFDPASRKLAYGLSFVAGLTDAVGYLQSGGYFVSFMSGNSTRLGVGLSSAESSALLAGGLIAAFLGGVFAGSLLGARLGANRRPAIIAGIAALLFAGTTILLLGYSLVALLVVAAAMGMENTIFEADGEVAIGLTYMTGALVKMGQHLAGTPAGAHRGSWLPFALIWLSLASGAALGALLYRVIGPVTLLISAIAMALLAAATWRPGLRA